MSIEKYREEDRNKTLADTFHSLDTDLAHTLSPENRTAFQEALTLFLTLFPQDVGNARSIFEPMLREHECTAEYFRLIQALFQDAAAFGFPKIWATFSSESRSKVQRQTQRSFFHVCNILALRVYLADINLQCWELKNTYLEKKSWELFDNPEEYISLERAVYGSMLKVQNGRVRDEGHLDGARDRQKFPQHRVSLPSDRVFLPNKLQAQSLLAVGESLGRRPRSDRYDTYLQIGTVTSDKLLKVFPDLQNPGIQGTLPHKQLIETAFQGSLPQGVALTYDELSELFRTELVKEK